MSGFNCRNIYGLISAVSSNSSSFSLNSATTFLGFSFVCHKASALATMRVYVGGKSGTPADIRASLYLDNGGIPNPSGAVAGTETTGVSVSAVGWLGFDFNINYTDLISGQRYWVVLKNYTSTPASNYPTITYGTPAFVGGGVSDNPSWGLSKASTSTGDSGWGSVATGGGCVFELSDGSKYGMPASVTTVTNISSNTTEAGEVITAPTTGLVVVGVDVSLYKNGSPTGGCKVKLYVNRNLVAVSEEIPEASISTTRYRYQFVFSRPIAVPPRAEIRAVVAPENYSSGNYYILRKMSWSPEDVDMLPGMSGCVTTDGGVTWSDDVTSVHPIGLLLQADNGFPSATVNRRTSTGR